jgi:asparagine synthase (glutamine-hydrolysing)
VAGFQPADGVFKSPRLLFSSHDISVPGIAGIISSPREKRAALGTMVKHLVHEPFDVAGEYQNERLGLAIGWVYQAGSFSDPLPAWNEDKSVGLIFAGENFAEREEIENLRAQGHFFDSGDVSSLPHLYEEAGLTFLEKLNGWFSGLLIDLREQKIVLFNDRYGLGRIYFQENADGFYFSSQAKSLLSILPETRRLDAKSLAESLSCGCVMQNRTLFNGVSLLPGASAWSFSNDEPLKRETYFRKEAWENQEVLPNDQYYENFRETFTQLLPKYFPQNNRVGMSLTGGIDGRMIMAWSGNPPQTLPCYSFGGPYRECADVRIARRVARVCRQPYEVIPVGNEFLTRFSVLAAKAVYISDGAMDVTGSVELYANQKARKIAFVRMTGNYGSEIVRGKVAFKARALDASLYDSELVNLGQSTIATYAEEAKDHPVSFIAFKQMPWHHYSRLAVEQSQLTLRTPYLDNALVSLMYRAPRNLVLSNEPSLRLIADGNSALSRIPTDLGLVSHSPSIITMAHQAYEQFTVRAEYAYDYGMPQWLARVDHAMAPLHLERLFLGRHKFYHFRIWYRDVLAHYVKEMLLDPRTLDRPYINPKQVEKVVTDHITGRANHTSEIHRLLTSELIQRQLIEVDWK